MDTKTRLKILFTIEQMSMQKLAEELSAKAGEKYTKAALYGKINRDTITYTECRYIADILGYELEFKKKDTKNF